MLHEAINWNFSEFSPSTGFDFSCAIYSLIVFSAHGFINLTVLRLRASSFKSVGFAFQMAEKNRVRRATMCNCPSDMVLHLLQSLFPQLHLTFSISCRNRFAVHFFYLQASFESSSGNFMNFFDSNSLFRFVSFSHSSRALLDSVSRLMALRATTNSQSRVGAMVFE